MPKRFTFLKLLVVFLCLMPTGAWGQPTLFDITFDAGDTVYPHAIVIDTLGYHHNSWQIGKPNKTVFDSAYSYTNAIVTDTLNPYLPNDTSVFILKLRYHFSSSWLGYGIDRISFKYKLDVDTGSFGIVEYSLDNGHSWLRAAPFSWYPPDTSSFKTSTLGWQDYTIDFAGGPDTLLVRFTFISDSDTLCGDGWMIDNFHIFYWAEGAVPMLHSMGYNIYPNPAHDMVGISAKDPIHSLAITNIMGQQVFRSDYDATDITAEIKQLPPGLYFVNLNGMVAGKFLKE